MNQTLTGKAQRKLLRKQKNVKLFQKSENFKFVMVEIYTHFKIIGSRILFIFGSNIYILCSKLEIETMIHVLYFFFCNHDQLIT